MTTILALLIIIIAIGITVIIRGFFVAMLIAEVFIFLTGLNIIMTPVQSCINGCFTTFYDSRYLGWLLTAIPLLTLVAYLIMRYRHLKHSSVDKSILH